MGSIAILFRNRSTRESVAEAGAAEADRELVVDELEMVDIRHDDRQGSTMPEEPGPLLLQAFVERAAGQSEEGIGFPRQGNALAQPQS